MVGEPTYQELQQRVAALERDLAQYRLAEKAPFDVKFGDSLLHPGWPEIKWNISGIFIYRRFLSHLAFMMERWNSSQVLGSFHDAPDVLWNGGRINNGVRFYDDSARYFKMLNDRGIGVFLTFSNLVLEEKHLADHDSNRLLECLDETSGLNGVIVASDLLSDYLRKKRPGLKQVSSVVKCFLENPEGKIEWYEEMQKRFDRVVVHTDHMFDLRLLDKLDRSKSEILITEECVYQCPNRQRHQRLISKYNIDKSEEVKAEIQKIKNVACKGGAIILDREKNPDRARSCYLTHAEVKTLYDMGFRAFKISGRRKPLGGLVWNLIHFLFNPDMAYAVASTLYGRVNNDIVYDIKELYRKKADGPSRSSSFVIPWNQSVV